MNVLYQKKAKLNIQSGNLLEKALNALETSKLQANDLFAVLTSDLYYKKEDSKYGKIFAKKVLGIKASEEGLLFQCLEIDNLETKLIFKETDFEKALKEFNGVSQTSFSQADWEKSLSILLLDPSALDKKRIKKDSEDYFQIIKHYHHVNTYNQLQFSPTPLFTALNARLPYNYNQHQVMPFKELKELLQAAPFPQLPVDDPGQLIYSAFPNFLFHKKEDLYEYTDAEKEEILSLYYEYNLSLYTTLLKVEINLCEKVFNNLLQEKNYKLNAWKEEVKNKFIAKAMQENEKQLSENYYSLFALNRLAFGDDLTKRIIEVAAEGLADSLIKENKENNILKELNKKDRRNLKLHFYKKRFRRLDLKKIVSEEDLRKLIHTYLRSSILGKKLHTGSTRYLAASHEDKPYKSDVPTLQESLKNNLGLN